MVNLFQEKKVEVEVSDAKTLKDEELQVLSCTSDRSGLNGHAPVVS